MNVTYSFDVKYPSNLKRVMIVDIETDTQDGKVDINFCDLNQSFAHNLKNKVHIYDTYEQALAVYQRYIKLLGVRGNIGTIHFY